MCNPSDQSHRLADRRPTVEAIMLILISIFGLVALDVASYIWGVDSRDPYQDDHAR